MSIYQPLASLICASGLVLTGFGICAAQGTVVMSNLSGSYSATTIMVGNNARAMGFTMGASWTFDLTEVRLALTFSSLDSMPSITLHSNNAQNNPGTLLAEFEPIILAESGAHQVSFIPKAQPFKTVRLQASTTYWLVVRPLIQGELGWQVPTGNAVPFGFGTHFGSRSGPYPPTSIIATNHAYELRGTYRSGMGLFFQDPSTGRIGVAGITGLQFTNWRTFPQVVGSQWEVLTFGNFGGTNRADALLRNKNTGQLAFWQTNGYNFTTFVPIPQIPPSVWEFKGAARLNSGLDYLFYQNPQSGVVVAGIHDGTQITQWRIFPKVPNPAWEIVAVAGFNFDEIADVMFRHKTTGQYAVWLTNGFDFTTWNVFPQIPSAQWEAIGTDDSIFTSFRRVIFRNKTTGELASWETNSEGTAFGVWRPFIAKQPAGYIYKGSGAIE